ncbi:MAG: glycosyltransferase family 9 protein [Elusimicrobia bacterium]|nr:glycosyltransferase family 9 protein [Elusimicrobiota bacterium]
MEAPVPVGDVDPPRRSLLSKAAEAADILCRTLRLVVSLPFSAEGPVPAEPRRVVVLAYGAVGDTIFFLPALEALRKAWPKARIVYVADYYVGTDMLAPSGLADEYWRYSSADLWSGAGSARRDLCRRLADEGFDVAVVGLGTPLRGLGPGLLKIPVRVGHVRAVKPAREGWSGLRLASWKLRRLAARQELERRLVLNRKIEVSLEEHAVRRNLRLVEALGLKAPSSSESRPRLAIPETAEVVARRELPDAPAKRTIGLHLGPEGTNYAKLWPLERWASALKIVAGRVPCRVAVLGGPEERERASRFADAYGGDCVQLAGKLGMLETFAAISRCDLFCSSDTGLSKAAMALGVPTVSVWGPVERSGYGVVWEPEKHAEVFHSVPCAPCVRVGTAEEGPGVINFTNCGHHDCLNRLEAPAAAETILRRLGAEAPKA